MPHVLGFSLHVTIVLTGSSYLGRLPTVVAALAFS